MTFNKRQKWASLRNASQLKEYTKIKKKIFNRNTGKK